MTKCLMACVSLQIVIEPKRIFPGLEIVFSARIVAETVRCRTACLRARAFWADPRGQQIIPARPQPSSSVRPVKGQLWHQKGSHGVCFSFCGDSLVLFWVGVSSCLPMRDLLKSRRAANPCSFDGPEKRASFLGVCLPVCASHG